MNQVAEIADEIRLSTVKIVVLKTVEVPKTKKAEVPTIKNKEIQKFLGSGVLTRDEQGRMLAITNHHVIENSINCEINFI